MLFSHRLVVWLAGGRLPRASLRPTVRPPARLCICLKAGDDDASHALLRCLFDADCLGALNGFHPPLTTFDAVVRSSVSRREGVACSLETLFSKSILTDSR